MLYIKILGLLICGKNKFLILYINGRGILSKAWVVKYIKILNHFTYLLRVEQGLESLI